MKNIMDTTSQTEVDRSNSSYEIKFLIPAGKSVDDVTENMKSAFEMMELHKMGPSWITEADCYGIKTKVAKLFVCDPFSGPAYNHLVAVNCRIMGPLCILACTRLAVPLPHRNHSVYSVAFRNVAITCTNMDRKVRTDVYKKVQLMGGFYNKDLTKMVTHVVAGEVGSKKYHVAANVRLPIMMPSWIEECWNRGQFQHIHATDACYEKHRCPIFKGLSITVSQLDSEERRKIQQAVETNGGKYSGALKAKSATHLILLEPKGDKYKFARSWKLHCVKVDWLYDSLESGYCMDEDLYRLSPSEPAMHGTSTPTNKDFVSQQHTLVDCSAIDNVSIRTTLSETLKSEVSLVYEAKGGRNPSDDLGIPLSSLENITQFLDGCRIYFTGLNGGTLEKLRKIVNAAGGMRFNRFTEGVTHVVVGDKTVLPWTLGESATKPFVVDSRWLIDCCSRNERVEETPYLCPGTEPVEEGTRGNIGSSLANDIGSNKVGVGERTAARETELEINKDEDIDDILVQYLPTNDASGLSLPTESKSLPKDYGPDPVRCCKNDDEKLEQGDGVSGEDLFKNMKFFIVGFGAKDEKLLVEMIKTNLGIVLPETKARNQSATAIAIVPVTGIKVDSPFSEILTNCWLQMCIEQETLLPTDGNPLFRPLNILEGVFPLKGCVLSFSQYAGTERDCLVHLAEVLGARCQEYFVRKENRSRGLHPNTHLVVQSPEGNKYEAAKKWAIPAVTKEWLIMTATMGKRENEDNFLVKNATLDQVKINLFTEKYDKLQGNSFDTPPPKGTSLSPVSAIDCKGNTNVQCIAGKTHSSSDEVPYPQFHSIQGGNIENDQRKPTHSEPKDPNSEPRDLSFQPVQAASSKGESKSACREKEGIEIHVVPEHQVSVLVTEASNDIKPLDRPLVLRECDNTPNRVLNPEFKYLPEYDIQDVLKTLDTPEGDPSKKRKSSLPLADLFDMHLATALQTFGVTADESPKNNGCVISRDVEATADRNMSAAPLAGIVLCTSKKLQPKQSELYRIVSHLGGDYVWVYDHSCTHLVHEGKSRDLPRDAKMAKEQGKKIVSPHWVFACQEEMRIVEEACYPCDYNPKMSLSSQLCSRILDSKQTHSVTQDVPPNKMSGTTNNRSTVQPTDVGNSINHADMSKQLEELLLAAKDAMAGKRKSRRSSNSTSLAVSSSPDSARLAASKQVADRNVSRSGSLHSQVPSAPSEVMQSVPIVWDDPTRRQEIVKIAEQLARDNVQDSESQTQQPEQTEEPLPCSPPKVSFVRRDRSPRGNAESERSLLEGTPKCARKTVKFMLSGLGDRERNEYSSIIRDLDGTVSDLKVFDSMATHLILGHPLRNEKFLASVASGKWVLHKSYITACHQEGKFIEEEPYEWGGPNTESFVTGADLILRRIAHCPHRWRIKLGRACIQSTKNTFGAFNGWRAIVLAENSKSSMYCRILEVGGAKLVTCTPPFDNSTAATHAFVELPKKSLASIDLKPLVSSGVMCLKPEYLAVFLVEDPCPPVAKYLLPEAVAILDSNPDTRKRKVEVSMTEEAKKSRPT